MSQEFYSYDVSTEYDDDQLHYHSNVQQDTPIGEVSARDSKKAPSSAAKDGKRGFFSRLFSSKTKEKQANTPSLLKQFSQKTPNKSSTGKQRSQSAPRLKAATWHEKTTTEHEKHQVKAPQQQARNTTPDMQRRGSFELDPEDDNGMSPSSFYGSSFHQSMDEYHGGASMIEREVVVGGTKEPPPQPYYLQSYNQLMQHRHQQQHKQFQQAQLMQQQFHPVHQQAQQGFISTKSVNSSIQRSENNSGIGTPVDPNTNKSRPSSNDVGTDQALNDPEVQAFIEKHGITKEQLREDKLTREMMAEATLLGISPGGLIPSDNSTNGENSNTQYLTSQKIASIQQHQQSHFRRPSQANHSVGGSIDLASKSNDSYDRHIYSRQTNEAPPIDSPHYHQQQQNPQTLKVRSVSNDSYDREAITSDSLKYRPLPPQPGTPPISNAVVPQQASQPVESKLTVSSSDHAQLHQANPSVASTTVTNNNISSQLTSVNNTNTSTTGISSSNTTPVSAASAADVPPHPLHDFVGIPKGVQFDSLHVMHADNAEILKIAAALLQKARRHPHLPKTEGIPREVAAAQLATMWLNQATFVRRRAGPDNAAAGANTKSSNQQHSTSKPALVPFPKTSIPKPIDPTKAKKQQSPIVGNDTDNAKQVQIVPAASSTGIGGVLVVNNDPPPAYTMPTKQLPPSHTTFAQSSGNEYSQQQSSPTTFYPSTTGANTTPASILASSPTVGLLVSHYENLARSGSHEHSAETGSPYLIPQSASHDSPPGGQRSGRKVMRVAAAEDPVGAPIQRRPSPMGMMRQPDYARDRTSSEGRLLHGDDSFLHPQYAQEQAIPSAIGSAGRSAPMSRQTSTNNAPPPPPLFQQKSKRGVYSDDYETLPNYAHLPPAYPHRDVGYDSYGDAYDDGDEYLPSTAALPIRRGSSSSSNHHHHQLQHQMSSTSAFSQMNNTGVTANGTWACKYCTLINEPNNSRCSACEAPRSKGPLIV